MIYLVGQLSIWLLATAAFAALAGWAWAGERAAPAARILRRDRDNLLRDLMRVGAGESGDDAVQVERESDAMRRLIELRDGRIAELEQNLAGARARADEAASRAAELERGGGPADDVELTRLRALAVAAEEERGRVLDVAAEPVEDEPRALQAWRLRYFEQRVRYLEGMARMPAVAVEGLQSPFAANADVDMLLRWRLLYLERRAGYLQEQAALPAVAEPAAAPAADSGPDPDCWKWRARYLEARVRHLESRPAPQAVAMSAAESVTDAPPPAAPRADAVKPPVLAAARNGGPDDFTLIEAVSALQQTTLYSIGVFHFEQIAAWTPANVAWVDQYLRLRGRIDEEEWVEQADTLAREGVGVSRRALVDEDA